MHKVSCIRSGGQTGADRGALDAARAASVPVCGWCPKGGWAEDLPDPPGLLVAYPELHETPSTDPAQRTEWNVRDSDATLAVCPAGLQASPGTQATIEFARAYGKPYFVIESEDEESVQRIQEWLNSIEGSIELNVAGPRASEDERAYAAACSIVTALLDNDILLGYDNLAAYRVHQERANTISRKSHPTC